MLYWHSCKCNLQGQVLLSTCIGVSSTLLVVDLNRCFWIPPILRYLWSPWVGAAMFIEFHVTGGLVVYLGRLVLFRSCIWPVYPVVCQGRYSSTWPIQVFLKYTRRDISVVCLVWCVIVVDTCCCSLPVQVWLYHLSILLCDLLGFSYLESKSMYIPRLGHLYTEATKSNVASLVARRGRDGFHFEKVSPLLITDALVHFLLILILTNTLTCLSCGLPCPRMSICQCWFSFHIAL